MVEQQGSGPDTVVAKAPLQARPSPFRALKLYGGLIAAIVMGLGIWKAWEIVVDVQRWYGVNRVIVNAVLVLMVLSAFVLAVVGVNAKIRRKKEERRRFVKHADANKAKIQAARVEDGIDATSADGDMHP